MIIKDVSGDYQGIEIRCVDKHSLIKISDDERLKPNSALRIIDARGRVNKK